MSGNPGLVVRELTPPGPGGVSVVEARGRGAAQWIAERLGCRLPPSFEPTLVRLRDGDRVLDRALCLVLSPELVELHLHGSPPIVRRVVELLEPDSAASPANGLCARAHARLARTTHEWAARVLLDQAEGAFTRVLGATGRCDEPTARRAWEAVRERGRIARYLVEPARVVLGGSVNSGKSTLFNLLVGHERALTSDQAGTTRDLLIEAAELGRYPVVLIDSAGERSATDAVELAGQSLAREARSSAQWVLWLTPCSLQDDLVPPRAQRLASKADLWRGELGVPAVSAQADPLRARAVVAELFRARFELPLEPWRAGAAAPFDDAGRAAVERLCREPKDPAARLELSDPAPN